MKRRCFIESVSLLTFALCVTLPMEGRGAEIWRDGRAVEKFSTTQEAIDRAAPGDTIRVPPGVHFEHLRLVKIVGTSAAPITIEGRPGARPVFEGGFEPLTHAPNALWRAEPAIGPGVYSAELPPPYWTAVYLASGERLFSHLTLDALGASPGAYVDRSAKRLYVMLPDGSWPGAQRIFAAHRPAGAPEEVLEMVDCRYVVVRGIEFRHGGRATVRVADSRDVTLEDIVVRGGRAGVSIAESSRNVLVTRSRVVGWHDPDWLWVDQKHNAHMESNGIVLSAGPANRVEYTEVSRWFNGINAKNRRRETTAYRNRNLVLRYNHVFDIVDDGIELDGYLSAGRIYENRVEDVFSGVSMSPRFSPRERDVLLFFRNTVRATKAVRFARGTGGVPIEAHPKIFKLGSGHDTLHGGANVGPEGVRVYQNDLFSTHFGIRSGFGSYPDVPPRDWHWLNNVITTQNGPTFIGTGSADDGVVLDGNVYHQTSDTPMFLRWNGGSNRFWSLAEARAESLGWEGSGEEARPDGAMVDSGVDLAEELIDTVVVDGRRDRGAFEQSDDLVGVYLFPRTGRMKGGERVVVRGRYFDRTTRVWLGGKRLVRETVISPNVITGFAPASESPGVVSLVVEKQGKRLERRRAYQYE